jgi:transglutaminase-like putative cysteine protease
MHTSLSLTDRFVIHVPSDVYDMTVRLAVPKPTLSEHVDASQIVGALDVDCSEQPQASTIVTDSFGNEYRVLTFHDPAPGDMTVALDIGDIQLSPRLSPSLPSVPLPVTGVPEQYRAYLASTPLVQSDDSQIRALAKQIAGTSRSEDMVARRICQWMQSHIVYGETDPSRSDALSTANRRTAICEGWAHLFLALARANGIPARFVGGYTVAGAIRYPTTGNGKSSVTVTTASQPHAWVELWYPGAGWAPYDPQSSAGFVDSHHVRVWVGPDADSVLPIVSWTADAAATDQLSFVERQSAGSVRDDFSIACAAANPPTGYPVLLTR